MQRYGASRIQQVMLSEGWYREHMPPVKAALEDARSMVCRATPTSWRICEPCRSSRGAAHSRDSHDR